MADPLPDKNALPSIEEGSAIWTKTAEEIQRVVKEYENYIRVHDRAGTLDKERYRLTQRTLMLLSRLRREMARQNKEGGAFAQTISSLSSKFEGTRGARGAVTRFTQAATGLFSKMDEGTGMMRIFGKETAVSASKFNVWVASVTLAANAIVSLLDAQDKFRIRQAELIRSFGTLGNINISAPYEAAAEGISVAGRTGGEAAKALQDSLLKIRVPAEQLTAIRASIRGIRGGEKGGIAREEMNTYRARGLGPLADLTRLTVGGFEKTPEYLATLRAGFATRDVNKLVQSMKEMGAVAQASGGPMEQMIEQIMKIGLEFVHTGMSIEDATGIFSRFADAVGKGELPMQMAVDAIKRAQESLRTGAGADRLIQTAAFTAMNFDKLESGVQKALDNIAQKLYGTSFVGLNDVMRQQGVLRKLSEEPQTIPITLPSGQTVNRTISFDQLFLDANKKMIDQITEELGGMYGAGGIAKQKLVPTFTGLEFGELDKAWSKVVEEVDNATNKLVDNVDRTAAEIGAAVEEASRKPIEARRRMMADILTDFDIYVRSVAKNHKEWTSKFDEMWEDLKGSWAEFIQGETHRIREYEAKIEALNSAANIKLGGENVATEISAAAAEENYPKILDILSKTLTPSQISASLQENLQKNKNVSWMNTISANPLAGASPYAGANIVWNFDSERKKDLKSFEKPSSETLNKLAGDQIPFDLYLDQGNGKIQHIKLHVTAEWIKDAYNMVDSLEVDSSTQSDSTKIRK